MKTLNMLFVLFLIFIFLSAATKPCIAQSSSQKTLWQIGNADNSDAEFALAPFWL